MKHCCFCKEEIKGRSDKKFCDDGCRSSYHHQINGNVIKQVQKTHYILRKNRRIISHFYYLNKAPIYLNDLVAEGFESTYHTRIIAPNTGIIQFVCYDFAYQIDQNNRVYLSKIC